jgi:hypothetical protein
MNPSETCLTDYLSKFDAVKLSHLVDAEYGNQGIDFKFIPREGFGWMNCETLKSVFLIQRVDDHSSGIPSGAVLPDYSYATCCCSLH